MTFDAGDWSEGSIYDLFDDDKNLPICAFEFFDHNNYDCICLGNHEFEKEGLPRFEKIAEKIANLNSNVKIISTNV